MKVFKNIVFTVLIGIIVLGLAGCGLGDWKYELVGGYEIRRINSNDIILADSEHSEGSSSIVILNYCITDFCMNQEYIGVQGIRNKGLSSSYRGVEIGGRAFFLVDVTSDDVYGPYADEEDYITKCSEVSAGDMGEWTAVEDIAEEARAAGLRENFFMIWEQQA